MKQNRIPGPISHSADKKARMMGIYIFLAGFLSLVIAFFLYLVFRDPASTKLHTIWISRALMETLPAAGRYSVMDWMPSFIYVIALSLISIAVLGSSTAKSYLIPAFWFASAVVHEFIQKYEISPRLFAGVFDIKDIVAASAGACMVAGIIYLVRRDRTSPVGFSRQPVRNLMKISLAGLGVLCLTATAFNDDYQYSNRPIYLSYEKLREPITGDEPRELTQIGKIYIYKNYLLVNSRNEGIHIFDNSNPSSPKNLLFLEIPGNVDIAVKKNILYADSFIDLVAIDISDMNNVREVDRIEDLFPYNPFQAVGEGMPLGSVDESKGVIIGYD